MTRPASEQQAPAPAPPGVTPHPACPRCHRPVTGEFKFCPACAYRLRPGDLPPAEEPLLDSRDRWLHGLVALVFGLLLIGVVLVGIHLFREDPTGVPLPDTAEPLSRPLTVDDDLLESMVALHAGTADYVLTRPRRVPSDTDPDPDEGGADGDLEEEQIPVPVSVGPIRISRYETPRGMYAEFIGDIQAHPERVPGVLSGLWDSGHGPLAPWARRGIPPSVVATDGRSTREGARQIDPATARAQDPDRSATGILLAVPPEWIRIGTFEELSWALPEGTENLPVTGVSWYEAAAFASWASERLGVEVRLPTRKEWIRAGHGGETGARYPWGDAPLRYACNNANLWSGDDELLPVNWRYSDADGTTKDGLYAMSGNAREWTLNDDLILNEQSTYFWPSWSQEFEAAQVTAPTLGGSFQEGIHDCEVTERSLTTQAKYDRARNVGFRLRRSTSAGR